MGGYFLANFALFIMLNFTSNSLSFFLALFGDTEVVEWGNELYRFKTVGTNGTHPFQYQNLSNAYVSYV